MVVRHLKILFFVLNRLQKIKSGTQFWKSFHFHQFHSLHKAFDNLLGGMHWHNLSNYLTSAYLLLSMVTHRICNQSMLVFPEFRYMLYDFSSNILTIIFLLFQFQGRVMLMALLQFLSSRPTTFFLTRRQARIYVRHSLTRSSSIFHWGSNYLIIFRKMTTSLKML